MTDKKPWQERLRRTRRTTSPVHKISISHTFELLLSRNIIPASLMRQMCMLSVRPNIRVNFPCHRLKTLLSQKPLKRKRHNIQYKRTNMTGRQTNRKPDCVFSTLTRKVNILINLYPTCSLPKTTVLWIICWEIRISLGAPLERWHAWSISGLSRLCAVSLHSQTAFLHFYAWVHH